MKRLMILILLCVMGGVPSRLSAQKMLPVSFFQETDSSSGPSLKLLTEVQESTSTFIRLYLKGTQLGKESYLFLEATDGATQRLTNEDLENWNFSSAYFNGNSVRVSLFSADGEFNKVVVNSIQVSDGKIANAKPKDALFKKDFATQTSDASINLVDYDLLPHAAAVGRFTNGNESYGTGWIAPNGAIITSQQNVERLTQSGFDIIEFNIPPSDSYGVINHPDPADQYPVKYRSETQALLGFDFKRKHDFSVENEENDHWITTWGILEALPNATGLRPGERQQQFFRIAPNLGSFTLNSQDVWVDILHYGETNDDLMDDGTKYRTLKKHVTKLQPQSEYIASGDIDIENYMVYNLGQGNSTFTDSDTGAPITYSNYNIAMGVHTDFYNYAPAVAVGFKHTALQSSLNDYFSSKMIYVDQGSLWDSSTGTIDKPYLDIQEGIDQAEIGGIVNIVKGNYHQPMYITKAVTLKAPVGTVVIGDGELTARNATLPVEFFMDPDPVVLTGESSSDKDESDLKSFPNPFTSITDITYKISKSTPVRVSVYDRFGNTVRSLLEGSQGPGIHSVVWDGTYQNGSVATPGLYVIRMETPQNSKVVKVIKR